PSTFALSPGLSSPSARLKALGRIRVAIVRPGSPGAFTMEKACLAASGSGPSRVGRMRSIACPGLNVKSAGRLKWKAWVPSATVSRDWSVTSWIAMPHQMRGGPVAFLGLELPAHAREHRGGHLAQDRRGEEERHEELEAREPEVPGRQSGHHARRSELERGEELLEFEAHASCPAVAARNAYEAESSVGYCVEWAISPAASSRPTPKRRAY